MGYRLSIDRPVGAEVRRIAQQQLARAEHELSASVTRFSSDRVHLARTRLKKVRALLRLVRPAMGKTYRRENRPLRRVGHRLGAIADVSATVQTAALLRKKYQRLVPASTVAALGRSLTRRQAVAHDIAGNSRALSVSVGLLQMEHARAAEWTLHAKGFVAVAGGLERTFRAARRAMQRATARPTARRLHTWRRRAKDQWLQLRLLEGHCGAGLGADRRALDMLNGVLGEYHDLELLTSAVAEETSIARAQRADVLRAVARERRRLRRRAQTLASRVYRDKPKSFVRRVERLWHRS